MTTAPAPDAVTVLAGFAHALRDAGVAADRGRLLTAIEALTHVDVADGEQVYWAARVALCAEPDDLPRFEVLFDLWFRGLFPAHNPFREQAAPHSTVRRPVGASEGAGDPAVEDHALATSASDTEVLRHRDVATLDDLERAQINRMIALLAPRMGRRRTLRREPGGRRRVDVRATVRAMLGDGGEPVRLVRDRRRDKPRRLVLLLDISGSMAPYAEVLLHFAHAAVRVAPRTTEVFTVGSRLTRVTRQLRLRDPDLAMRAAGAAVPDWSGGTRLGESLRAFLDLWGQRGIARGAVTVIASDGWERGDAELLGVQMARLSRLAHRVVWVNPHRGKEGYAPVTAGMVAALPSIDELVAGHSFQALRRVAEVIASA